MCDDEVFRCRIFSHVVPQIGGDPHLIVSGNTLELQRRTCVVMMQYDFSAVIVEIDVYVFDGYFVRCPRGFSDFIGLDFYFDRNATRIGCILSVVMAATV